MTVNRTRADYEQLGQIAQRFGREYEAAQRLLSEVQRQVEVLQGGDWAGQGARAFYSEMTSAVLPSLRRLANALQSAQRVTAQINQAMKQAEDEAAALLRDNTGALAHPVANAAMATAASGGGGLLGQVGGFFKGLLWEGPKGMVEGVWHAVSHPLDTVRGLAYGITHPGQLWDALKKPYVDDWKSGNYGQAIGRGVFEVGMLLIPGVGEAKGVAKGAEVANTAGKMAEVSEAARAVASGEHIAEAANLAEKVGETARTAQIIDEAMDVAHASGSVSESAQVAAEATSRMKYAGGIPADEGARIAQSIRSSLQIEGRNVAIAESELDGQRQLLAAVSGKNSPPGTLPAPEAPIFTTKPSGAMTRAYDTEVKILEDAARNLTPESKGSISLYTERAPCLSCQSVIKQFEERFPNIKVIVTSGP